MILRDLDAANPGAELWWDSLPDTREYWKEKLAEDSGDRREEVEAELRAFFDGDPSSRLAAKGATSNPNLVWESVSIHRDRWKRFVVEAAEKIGPVQGARETVYWMLYLSLFETNAGLLLPSWEASGGRYGWVCAQVLSASLDQPEQMIREGMQLASLAPNVMVKLPATEAGFKAMEVLTGRGVSVNSTLSFTVSQALHAAAAVKRGRDTAWRRGIDPSKTRAVATFMTGRLTAERELLKQAEEAGLALAPLDLRRIELLVFAGIARALEASGMPMTPLLSSLRIDTVDGKRRCLHLEECSGSARIYTLPPAFLAELLALRSPSSGFGGSDPRASAFPAVGSGPETADERPEGLSIDALLSLPYVRLSYEADALAAGDCGAHPAYYTGRAFSEAGCGKTLRFIDGCLGA